MLLSFLMPCAYSQSDYNRDYDKCVHAWKLMSDGDSLLKLKNNDQALVYYQSALHLFTKLYKKEPLSETHVYGLSSAYGRVADAYNANNNKEKALEFYIEENDIIMQQLDRMKKRTLLIEALLNSYINLGTFYKVTTPEKAKIYFKMAEETLFPLLNKDKKNACYRETFQCIQNNMTELK